MKYSKEGLTATENIWACLELRWVKQNHDDLGYDDMLWTKPKVSSWFSQTHRDYKSCSELL